MRDWMEHTDALEAAGGRLLVLTSDAPHRLRAAVERKSLDAPFASVDPSVWAAWGLANPKNPDLPHPATFVVRDGRIVFREIHVDFRKRTPPERVLAALTSPAAPPAAAAAVPAPDTPDWDGAVALAAAPSPTGAVLTVTVADGFHVYGAKESEALPLAITGGVATVPDGERRTLGRNMGPAWVLDGVFHVTVTGARPLAGEVRVQACTASACSPPRTLPWAVD